MPEIAIDTSGTPNPFAQFDHLRLGDGEAVTVAAPSAPASASAGVNPFAKFDHLREDQPKSSGEASPTIGSIAKQVPTGFNEVVADVAGAPIDAATWLLNHSPSRLLGINPAPKIEHPVGGSESIKSGMEAIGIPNPDKLPAQNTAERIARGVGGGAAGMLAPELMGAGIAKAAPSAADMIGAVLGRSSSVADLASSGAIGASAGGSGQAAAELAPDQYKPLASTIGGLAGGVGAALTTQIPRAIMEGARSARDYAAPLTPAGQERVAAERLASSASNPREAIEAIDNVPAEIVPGSKPTTFQVTGDMGLGGLERDIQTRNPVEFAQRRANQNAARVNSLEGVQTTGRPEDLSNFIRSRLADIDQTSNSVIEDATKRAQAATADLGGHQTPEFYGAMVQNVVAPRQNAAMQEAQQAVRQMGGAGTPDGYGGKLRNALQAAEDHARANEERLWNAVDPDNSLTVSMVPIQGAMQKVYGNLTKAAESGLLPTETTIQRVVSTYKGIEPFKELADLRSAVSSAMRDELSQRGRSPAYGRLSEFRGAIENSIWSAVEHRAAHEAEAVARGEMRLDATMASNFQKQVSAWYAEREAGAGENAFASAGGRSSARSTPIARSSRTPESSGRQFGDAPRDQSLPGALPNFDEAARERLTDATRATSDRARTYNQGTVGQTLKTLGSRGNYRMPDATVPTTVFKAGPNGFEAVNAFKTAVGDDRAAVDTLRNYAASSLRRDAERPDGTLDPNRFNMWRRKYQDALRAIPEVQRSFASAAEASEALQKFTPFRADIAPSAIPEQFFHSGPSGFEGVNQLRSLVGDATASTILSDYAASQVRKAAMRPDGVIDPAKFTRWQAAHSGALRALPGLSEKFATAAKATDAIEAAATARREAMDAYQTGAIGKLLGHTEASDVTREVGAIFGRRAAAQTMHHLAQEARQNPGALEGLRRSIVDHMYGKFISNAEAGTSGSNLIKPDGFQSFVRSNEAALKAVFSNEEYNVFKAIGTDLRRSNRSINAVRIPGQSNTAQDTIKQLSDKSPTGVSLLAKLAAAAAGGSTVQGFTGATVGVLGVLGQSVLSTAREAGLSKIDDLVKQALLDPQLARTLLLKAPERPNSGSAITLAQQLRRLAVFEAAKSTGGR